MKEKTSKPPRAGRRRTRIQPDEIAAAIDDFVGAAKRQNVPASVVVNAFADVIARVYSPAKRGPSRSGQRHDVMAFVENLRAAHELPELVDADVLSAGRSVFSTNGAVGLWLCTPAAFARGKRPVELLRTPAGKRKVIGVLLGLAHGNVI